MRSLHEAKILLVAPFLNYYGGAEYLFGVVANELFPNADIFTFSYKKKVLDFIGIERERVRTPFANGLMSAIYRELTPLYPAIIDSQNFGEYDIVISFSYGYVHGIVTTQNQLHVSYVHTPMRLLWLGDSERYWYDKFPGVREIYHSILTWQRLWDTQAAMRPDYLLANSGDVATRIKAFWNRKAEVLYPPVDVDFYTRSEVNTEKGDYFITHSRLVKYKKIDLLIKSMKLLKKNLVIVGTGPDERRLRAIAGNSEYIRFTGYVTHEQKRELLRKSRGFLFAAYEDFGIAPIEAMAAGIPVYVYEKGGVLETVNENCGRFFPEQTVESFCDHFYEFEEFAKSVDTKKIQEHAKIFNKEVFIKEFGQKIEEYWQSFQQEIPID